MITHSFAIHYEYTRCTVDRSECAQAQAQAQAQAREKSLWLACHGLYETSLRESNYDRPKQTEPTWKAKTIYFDSFSIMKFCFYGLTADCMTSK